MDLPTMRARVRQDLHDEDAGSYRWTDAVLDRHIERAVQESSLALPLQKTAEPTTVAGSRDIDVSGLTGRIVVETVEYPVDSYPRSFVRFSLWEDTLTLLVDTAPSGGETVRIYYGALHTLDATSSTLPARVEDIVATGAAAYAAVEWASYAINRVNVGGEQAWRSYMSWGQQQLSSFLRDLARLGRRSIRAQQLYTPSEPQASQTTDWGP